MHFFAISGSVKWVIVGGGEMKMRRHNKDLGRSKVQIANQIAMAISISKDT